MFVSEDHYIQFKNDIRIAIDTGHVTEIDEDGDEEEWFVNEIAAEAVLEVLRNYNILIEIDAN